MDRCTPGAHPPGGDKTRMKARMQLLAEISEFVREHQGIIARYHTYSIEDLDLLERRCRGLQEEACRRGACGSAGTLAELEYLIARAKELKGG
jgi:hypothetical protein